MSFRSAVAVAALAVGVCASCPPGPDPVALYAEAEALRLRQTEQTSRSAVNRYLAATNVWASRGQYRDAALAARQLGAAYHQLGLLHESADAYERAHALAARTPDRRLHSASASDLGTAVALVADDIAAFERARGHCERSLSLARQEGSAPDIARAFQCLGDLAYYRQRPDEALERYEEAGRILERDRDPSATASNLLLIGYVNSDLGRFDEAREHYERASAAWSELGDTRQQAITQVALAKLHARRGEYQDALERFDIALGQLQPMGDALWVGSTLAGLAEVQLAMGETDAARQHWERALRIFEDAGLHNIAIDVLVSLGKNDLASADASTAVARFQRALDRAEALGIDRWKALALQLIGVAQLSRQQPLEARGSLERALCIHQQLGASAGYRLEAEARTALGEAHRRLGDQDAALEQLTRSLALSRAEGDRLTQATTLYTLARTASDRGDLTAARERIEEALQVAESLRSDVLHRNLRESYVASIYEWYELHVSVLMRLGAERGQARFVREAFEASERARARSLLDGLADSEADLRSGIPQGLLEREQAVLDAFRSWAVRQGQATSAAQISSLAQEYKNLEFKFNQVQAEVRRKSAAYAALDRPSPARLGDVQHLLDEDTILLEYFLGENRSHLWVVTRTGLSSHTLAPRARIEPLARRVYELLTAPLDDRGAPPSAGVEYLHEARRLSDMLLGPLGHIPQGRRILVVADGSLHYLPFAALPRPGPNANGEPMIVHHEVVSIPSASTLLALRRAGRPASRSQKTVAVLADPVFEPDDPRLPIRPAVQPDSWAAALGRFWSRTPVERAERADGSLRAGGEVPRLLATRLEAEAIIRAAGGAGHMKALDFEASRATALAGDLAQYRIVHLATHSLFDNRNPGASGILLSRYDAEGRQQDGFLRLHDIYRLTLPVELVVLSACNTALGEPIKGEGLVGMVRGFMHAGARRVVASHWKVDDEATGELMRRFYVEMLHNHRSPAAALREAQLGMRKLDRWRAPFYWAAFVVQGEWK